MNTYIPHDFCHTIKNQIRSTRRVLSHHTPRKCISAASTRATPRKSTCPAKLSYHTTQIHICNMHSCSTAQTHLCSSHVCNTMQTHLCIIGERAEPRRHMERDDDTHTCCATAASGQQTARNRKGRNSKEKRVRTMRCNHVLTGQGVAVVGCILV